MPERSCVRIPPTSRSTSRRSSAAPSRPASAPSGVRRACRPGDRVAVVGCGGVGLSALLAAVAVGAEPVIAVDAAPRKLDVAREFGATGRVLWAATPEATAEAVREARAAASTTRSRRRAARGDAGGVPVDARARCGRADRDPARGRRAVAPGAHDPAHGAARPRLDLRLVEAGARLPRDARPVSQRPAAARPARLPPPAAGRGRAGLRAACSRARRSASCSTHAETGTCDCHGGARRADR